MKRMMMILCALMIALTFSPIGAQAEDPCKQALAHGDVDGDGVLTLHDLDLLIDIALGAAEPTEICDLNGDGKVNVVDVQFWLVNMKPHAKGDVNGDGEINVTDVMLILKMAGGELESNAAADVDCDGKVTRMDAKKLIDVILANM